MDEPYYTDDMVTLHHGKALEVARVHAFFEVVQFFDLSADSRAVSRFTDHRR